MGAALPPACDSDGSNVDADETHHSRTFKDKEHCAMESTLPPYNGDDDADKTARSRTTPARAFLTVGLVLEVSATLWAFQQAVSTGAFDADADCSYTSREAKQFASSLVVDECDGPIDADYLFNSTDMFSENYTSFLDEYAACDLLIHAPTSEDSLGERCVCSVSDSADGFETCYWVALTHPSYSFCYAEHVIVHPINSSEWNYILLNASTYTFRYNCWPMNPPGTVGLTITALVVALSSQLLEAFVGFKDWKDSGQRTVALTLAASIFETLGVIAVSSALVTLPGIYIVSDDTADRIPAMLELAWMAVASVVVGVTADITAALSDSAAARLPYLSAAGSGLVWLGAALIEVVVTSYLLWVGAGIQEVGALVREAAGFFVLELLGLVTIWIARVLWTRARLLRSVKNLEWPLRKRLISMHFKCWQYCAQVGTYVNVFEYFSRGRDV